MFSYKGYLYAWASLGLVLLCSLAYLIHQPVDPTNGDTWLGYTTGITASLIVVVLMVLGGKKRWWLGFYGSLQGWVSAHIYFGLSLIAISLLHSGFQLGGNIHSLTFIIMLLVIISGAYGAISYSSAPEKLRKLTNDISSADMLVTMGELEQSLLEQALAVDETIYSVLRSAIYRTWLPSSIGALFFMRDKSMLQLPDKPQTPLITNSGQQALTDWVRQHPQYSSLIADINNRQQLIANYRQARKQEWLLKSWLKYHLALSLLFLALLVAHIIIVLIY